jgi:hypothetical protein
MPSPSSKPLKTFLFVVGGLLFLLVLASHISMYWYEATTKEAVAPGRPEILGSAEGLVALAWVDEGEVSSDTTLRLWILLENRTDNELKDIHFLTFITPGFDKKGKCWQGGTPACRPQPGGGRPLLSWPKSLKKGESAVVYALLQPKSWYGYHGASGVLTWKDPTGLARERAVSLPAVRISSELGRVFATLGRSLDLAKDLALPVVLLVLAGFLQRRDRNREHTQEERDKMQALLRETWALMLPKVSTYAEQHYMPIESSIATFRDALKMDDPAEGHLQALFNLLLFLRNMQYLADETGGLFFRNLQGEELAGKLWFLFRERAWAALERKDYARAMTVLSAKENYADFLDKLEGRAPLSDKSDATPSLLRGFPHLIDMDIEGSSPRQEKLDAVRVLLQRLSKKFTDWKNAEAFSEDSALLNLFDYILSYEMNRPFVIWYEEPANLNASDFRKELDHLGPSLADLKQKLQAYLSRYEKEKEQREKLENA